MAKIKADRGEKVRNMFEEKWLDRYFGVLRSSRAPSLRSSRLSRNLNTRFSYNKEDDYISVESRHRAQKKKQ